MAYFTWAKHLIGNLKTYIQILVLSLGNSCIFRGHALLTPEHPHLSEAVQTYAYPLVAGNRTSSNYLTNMGLPVAFLVNK